MTTIVRASESDSLLLAEIGKISFIESHGNSASEAVIDEYVRRSYTTDAFKTELANPGNNYDIIYHGEQAAGFSKIVLNASHSNIPIQNLTKLDRLYLLKEFCGKKLGAQLLRFNVKLSEQNNQSGMWLFVWKENHGAVRFYQKAGFEIIGSYDFHLTEIHSNPNHQMLLKY